MHLSHGTVRNDGSHLRANHAVGCADLGDSFACLSGICVNPGISDLVIVGLTTPLCASTTVRMAGNLGFTVRVVGDAMAAFEWRAHDGKLIAPEDVHYHALAALHGEFAGVTITTTVLGAISPTD